MAPVAARYRAVAVLLFPSGEELVGEGMFEGRVIDPAARRRGLRLRPALLPDGRTSAELPPEAKDAISTAAKPSARTGRASASVTKGSRPCMPVSRQTRTAPLRYAAALACTKRSAKRVYRVTAGLAVVTRKRLWLGFRFWGFDFPAPPSAKGAARNTTNRTSPIFQLSWRRLLIFPGSHGQVVAGPDAEPNRCTRPHRGAGGVRDDRSDAATSASCRRRRRDRRVSQPVARLSAMATTPRRSRNRCARATCPGGSRRWPTPTPVSVRAPRYRARLERRPSRASGRPR